jgi:hypothetical protein
MALQRVTLRLTELRCITQSESGGSEPYLWVTYFAIGAQPLPFQQGPVATITPAYDAFRADFPDNVEAGQAMIIPPFLATASFDMDLDAEHLLVGCIAVLMEEDDTPDSSIILGRIAYSKEIDKQLNDLVHKRLVAGDSSPLKDEELAAIKDAVKTKVEDAVGSNQSLWNIFTDQDDNLGFAYVGFSDSEIVSHFFDFPQIGSDTDANRFVLSGDLSIGAIPTEPIDLCKTQRAAVKAKEDQIDSLQGRVAMLQSQLQHATPQQKAAIVDEIEETNALLTQAESDLPALQAALEECQHRHGHAHDIDVDPGVVLDPG